MSLCVLQVQTLYYSADHKLLDGALIIEEPGLFGVGAEEDHMQLVQVHNPPLPGPFLGLLECRLAQLGFYPTLCSLATRQTISL